MFQDLGWAYETLSDADTRKVYDRGGEEALKKRQNGGMAQHSRGYSLTSILTASTVHCSPLAMYSIYAIRNPQAPTVLRSQAS